MYSEMKRTLRLAPCFPDNLHPKHDNLSFMVHGARTRPTAVALTPSRCSFGTWQEDAAAIVAVAVQIC